MGSMPPGTLMLLGAIVIPLLRGRWLKSWVVALPIASCLHLLWYFPDGHVVRSTLFDQELTVVRVDRLSLVWGYVFHLAAVLGTIFAWQVRDRTQHFSAIVYVASSIGAVFAGDLLTLFVYWEITAISSVFLIWAGRGKTSFRIGMRYVLMHVGSGVLVLSGAILLFVQQGTLSFGGPGELGMFHELAGWGERLLLLGFGIKAAFPLLHCWLPEAYPASTPTGTVFLSAFTTKMAIYALARGFAGCEMLITIGCVMAIYPLLHALLADDLRRTLAHVLNNQLGFMVVAIGIGTPMAISGAAAQAFVHVIYKGLLFMTMGAVLLRVGTTKQTQLGGLAKFMPWTSAFCLVGALSVAPLNCGFVAKALILSAVAKAHLDQVWLILIAGAVGAFLLGGIKIFYFAFLARDYRGKDPVDEAPLNMLIAMGLSAALCLLLGIVPSLLYDRLPFSVADYHVYTVEHVVTQMQLMLFTGLAFAGAVTWGFYPQPVAGTLLDVDWLYRKPLPAIVAWARDQLQALNPVPAFQRTWMSFWDVMMRQCSEAGPFGRTVSTNAMAIAAIILLSLYLVGYYRWN